MRLSHAALTSSPTDLANFLSCRHKTTLDLLAAQGRIARPTWTDPLAEVLRDRGSMHEQTYIEALRARGLWIVDLTRDDDAPRPSDADAAALTFGAMREGADVIVQAPLAGDGWFGYADVLRRVDGTSVLGDWHYEVQDTKLARETRGGTILQLCVYSDILATLQHRWPDHFQVVTPVAVEAYRLGEFAAFYRLAVAAYRAFVAARAAPGAQTGDVTPYPQPTDHCDVCRWWERCNARRRADDHLSFVAGLGHIQQDELEARELPTLAALAGAPLPLIFKPRRGSRETYTRLREQARLQKTQRESGRPTFELLPRDEDFGLRLLPEPSPGDLFLDFEGDPFAREGGREYLVGLGRVDAAGTFTYEARWAFTDGEERSAFEWLVGEMCAAVAAHRGAHVYHFAPYEPAAIKRLMTRYATCEVDVDELLRGRRFVDLFAAVRQTLRAGVESYSIKKLEPFYAFDRDVDLERAGDQRRLVELALETGDVAGITDELRRAVEGYNRDDCRSTLALRVWLEQLRGELQAAGTEVPRPAVGEGEATEQVRQRDQRIADVRARLLARAAAEPSSLEAQAIGRMADLVGWHRREERVAWGDYHRLRAKLREALEDEPGALVGLEFLERLVAPLPGGRAKAVTDRYRFPPQELEIRKGYELRLPDDSKLGVVEAVDRADLTIDVKKTIASADVHPDVVIAIRIVGERQQEAALLGIGEQVARVGLDDASGDPLVNDLLLARPPRLRLGSLAREADESLTTYASRCGASLDRSLLAIQGPPGSGKTFIGAHMIAALVRRGQRVGVVATSHRVIRKLLADAAYWAARTGGPIRAGHKVGEDDGFDDAADGVENLDDNSAARQWLAGADSGVLGGTSWLWSRSEFAKSVDVLFVDEAGQIALANVLAVSQAAGSVVLLGDPQQLEQPQQASHPDGVGLSALQHVLGPHQTMPADRGIFLGVTWRLAPQICAFTSEQFYESRLNPHEGLERQTIAGPTPFSGAGLRVVDVHHDFCRNASDEEVDVVERIVRALVAPGVSWTNADGLMQPLTTKDLLVVAPYNAHVVRLRERLDTLGVAVGTVDKFQGQEAPVVIYSMATSRPEDAPRGMSFLYNPNRLNVATSRARCLCVLVASPRLFEPDCRTPQHMRLANALCRYREMATPVTVSSLSDEREALERPGPEQGVLRF